MRYIWICILIMFDVIWLISSIMDVVLTVKYVKEHRRYSGVGDFIDCLAGELKESTVGFIALHIFALFIVSFITWANFKIGDVK